MARPLDRRQARTLLFWSLFFVIALQVVLNVYVETTHPEVYDPEYRDRLVLLRKRVQEYPDRPLLLFVGSSRMMTGVAPEFLPPLASVDGEHPLPFNAIHTGAGPVHNLLMVQRLLRERFEPKWIVLEVVPFLLPAGQHSTLAKLALADDLPTLRQYVPKAKLYGWYAAERSTAIVNHRQAFLRCLAPGLPLQDSAWDCMPMEPLGGKTWTEPNPDRAEIVRRTAAVRANYYSNLQHFQIRDSSRQAMREVLELCRHKNIQVALLITPESSEFRSWYSPEAKQATNTFCQELGKEFSTPIIDAREWLSDDCFSDGHHVLPEGAKKLTTRIGTDVLQPLLRGELHQAVLNTSPKR